MSGGFGKGRIEPIRERIALRSGHVKPMLGASPEDVLGRLSPFMRDEIADLGLVKGAPKMASETF